MTTDLFDLLMRLTLAGSGAIVLALLVRLPLRRFAGADAVYLCWLTVPLALAAAALPALKSAPVLVLALAPTFAAPAMVSSFAGTGMDWLAWIVRIWLAGLVATGALVLLGQRAYVRKLGPLRARDGVFFATNASCGPALLGLLRPIVVVPADFATRYTADEQTLIIAHEHQHAARRDPVANALLALLQCVFWFNPLIHIAQSRFRFDQELACDAAVMARHMSLRQTYASAMLKTQATGAAALAACHWQSSHPLKERIMQLKHTSSTSRRRAGHLIVALLAAASVFGTVTARAGATAGADTYDIAVKFAEGEGNTSAKVRVKAGEDFSLRWSAPGQSWQGVFNASAAGESVLLKMTVTTADGKVIAPSVLLRMGEMGTVVEGDMAKPAFKVGVTVTRAAGV